MSFFSKLFGRSNKVQNNGKPIILPAPPQVTVDREMTQEEAVAAIRMASVPSAGGRGESFPLSRGYPAMADEGYFSALDADIPALARWLKSVEDKLTSSGYGYRHESGDCDDRADFAQSLRRFFRRPGHTLQIVKCSVKQNKPALGIGSGGGHQIIAIQGSTTWWPIDPATGQYCRLADYPNRFNIYKTTPH